MAETGPEVIDFGLFLRTAVVCVGCVGQTSGPVWAHLEAQYGRCQCAPIRHTPYYADLMKYFAWDDTKNAKLRTERGLGFEEIVFHIERGDLLDILEHPNPDRYAGQRILIVRREDD